MIFENQNLQIIVFQALFEAKSGLKNTCKNVDIQI